MIEVTTYTPITQHPYNQAGSYPANVTVYDTKGQPAKASVNQRVRAPVKPDSEPPYVAVSSTPTNPKPKEPVKFDASDSHDKDKDPCKTFLWDFGDGSPPKETKTPIVNHSFEEPGTYPVKVTAIDKYGKTGNAKLTQRYLSLFYMLFFSILCVCVCFCPE